MTSEPDGPLIADIDAERAVLGACMTSAAAVERAIDVLDGSDDFVRPAHRMIWRALVDLTVTGRPTDPVVLRDELRRRGEIARVGEGAYLAELYAVAPPGVEIEYHAGIVAGLGTRRRALEVVEHARQRLQSPEADAAEVVTDVIAALDLTRQERAGALGGPEFILLDDFLAVEDEPAFYRVDGLWPVGGRIVAAAQFKAGKTTMRDNVVRALVDKEEFLGAFSVTPPEGRVVIIDNELDERMLRRWLRDQGIVNTRQVAVLSLRGKVGTFDLRDRAGRARWATKLRAIEASVVILDCLRPVLDALGLSEDKDAGQFLVAFDALLDEAGVSEGLVNHHMGHNGERSRGDSRILDWPDVTWRLVREKGEDGETLADARRYFSAYGRDVDVPEGLLTYDQPHRRLLLAGGTRRETAADAVIPDILDYLTGNPGASGRAVESALSPHPHKRLDVRTALRRAIGQGKVDTAEGPRRAILHFATTPENASAPSAPSVRQRTSDECASAPIGRTAHTHPEEGQCAAAHSDDQGPIDDPR
ncbi:hypothetical protein GCM10027176_45850 [Actinoallomurus bryophytorum]|uniref:AAA domain-containing protein n=1 Tax=Actinoallomurus bryophytorum TaxID=1490222 RepID=A0A543CCG4_9ACTN|nr:DnaB-like helicase N-terminal domain-containing protein [Actinoallomurus bryophytorum]TQL94764.1 AAA domain-containing protein [Actinoallomurus bryophytorum]